MNEKKLSQEPSVHESCKILNSNLGYFTEIGMYNYLENIEFGDYSYSGEFCFIQNAEIGKFTSIAASVRIGPTDHPIERPTLHHFTYRRKMYGFDEEDDETFFSWREKQKTYIGNDVWIGHGAIIMPGVKIGNGAVIGAGAVVTKNVAPYRIVVGVPAKPVRNRFNRETIKRLEAISWWDWSHETIQERFQDFLLEINCFVDKYYRK
ncbi:MAG: chloramphenicol acetyltransferase [Clostridia bacterium]|nr:chloramphenicol acetyltransferase [Clostridia bacterium]